MTKKDKGPFSDKHRGEKVVSPAMTEAIRAKIEQGGIPCQNAEVVARDLDITMNEVGKAVDLLEIRINRCQLGLFGYRPETKIVRPAAAVSADLERDIRAALSGGSLSCRRAWKIAEKLAISKLDVSSACETLHIKIKPCQLGAF